MATIASQLFSRSAVKADEQEQLLKLFWNRAELKKEFDKLREDALEKDTQLRNQEALTLRVQQRLGQLEAQLANPDTAQRAIAYYQLRSIWHRCQERVRALADDLERACADREQREHLAAFQSKVEGSLVSVRCELERVAAADAEVATAIRELREQRSRKLGAWNWLSRRRLTHAISAKRQEKRILAMRLAELNDEIQARQAEEAPKFPGISIEAKRLINLRLIAYAQELCLHFAADELGNLAREAAARDLLDVRYGNRRDCRTLAHNAESVQQALEADTGWLKRVQVRARYLASTCKYRSDADTVPAAGTLDGIARLDAAGRKSGQASSINVLVDEYWDIFSVLRA